VNPTILIISLLWAAAIGLAAWYMGGMAIRITYVTLADGTRSERRLPLMIKMVLPFAPNVRWFNSERWAPTRKKVGRDLISSGFDSLVSPSEFLATKALLPLVIGPAFCAILATSLRQLNVSEGSFGATLLNREWIFYILTLLMLYIYPVSWLKNAVRARHRAIERGLPFVLDLLTLSVEAGLDFISALKRILERRKVDALSEELIRSLREMQVGRTRKEALKEMSHRINHSDITSVVNALVQADELGVSIGNILRIQSDQMRVRRFQRAEKAGNEAPVKLLFPLVCFIFPSVFLVLLGPIIIEMMKKGF